MSKLPRVVVPAAPKQKARAKAARRDRRQTWLRRTGWASAVVLPLLVAGWLLLGSGMLAVQQVSVVGEKRLTDAQVMAAAAVAPGTPLARVDTAAVKKRISALGPVATVAVDRSWPHGLRITVTERKPVVAVVHGEAFQLLDAAGVQVDEVLVAPHGLLKVTSGSPDATQAALSVLRSLPRGIAGRLGSLTAPTPEQVTLVLRDGRQVRWGGPVDNATKASAVLALIRMPGTVFDVSAPGVATRR